MFHRFHCGPCTLPARPSLFMPLICQKPAKKVFVFVFGISYDFRFQISILICIFSIYPLIFFFFKNEDCILIFILNCSCIFIWILPCKPARPFLYAFLLLKPAIIAYHCILIWILAMHPARLFLFMPFICQSPQKVLLLSS